MPVGMDVSDGQGNVGAGQVVNPGSSSAEHRRKLSSRVAREGVSAPGIAPPGVGGLTALGQVRPTGRLLSSDRV